MRLSKGILIAFWVVTALWRLSYLFRRRTRPTPVFA